MKWIQTYRRFPALNLYFITVSQALVSCFHLYELAVRQSVWLNLSRSSCDTPAAQTAIMRELPCLATPVNTSSALPVTTLAPDHGDFTGFSSRNHTPLAHSLSLSLSCSLAHRKLGILYSIRQRRKRRRGRLGNNSRSNLLTPEKG